MRQHRVVFVVFCLSLFGSSALFAAPKTAPALSPEVEARIQQLEIQLGELQKKLEEKPAETAEKKPTSGYDGGFFIQSEDGNFKFTINGGVTLKYAVGIGQEQNDLHTFGVTPLLILGGNAFDPNLAFSIVLAPASSALLQGADLQYTINNHLTIGGGYNSLALDVGLLGASSKSNQFVTAAMAAARYGTDSVGIGATGEVAKGFSYALGLQNGQGNGLSANANNEMSYFGELIWQLNGGVGNVAGGDLKHSDKLLMKVEAGANYSNEETSPEQRIIQVSAGGGAKYKGFNFYTQGFGMLTDPDDFTKQQEDIAFFAQAGYAVIKDKFEVALRYSALFDDINDAGVNYNSGFAKLLGGAGDVDGDSQDEYAYSFAMAYNFKGNGLRTVAEYTYWYDGKVGQDTVNHLLRFNLHARF